MDHKSPVPMRLHSRTGPDGGPTSGQSTVSSTDIGRIVVVPEDGSNILWAPIKICIPEIPTQKPSMFTDPDHKWELLLIEKHPQEDRINLSIALPVKK